MSKLFLSKIIVPVANKKDAVATVEALLPYIESISGEIIIVNVIEKAGGAPDKSSVEQREMEAENIFSIIKNKLEDKNISVKTDILYGKNVAKTIIDKAHNVDASSIVFTPRGGSKWIKLLTGDVITELINESDIPIIVFPDVKNKEQQNKKGN